MSYKSRVVFKITFQNMIKGSDEGVRVHSELSRIGTGRKTVSLRSISDDLPLDTFKQKIEQFFEAYAEYNPVLRAGEVDDLEDYGEKVVFLTISDKFSQDNPDAFQGWF